MDRARSTIAPPEAVETIIITPFDGTTKSPPVFVKPSHRNLYFGNTLISSSDAPFCKEQNLQVVLFIPSVEICQRLLS